MDTVLNLGMPSKDLCHTFELIQPVSPKIRLKITGVEVHIGLNIQMTSPVYGAGMTLDCLEEMLRNGFLAAHDKVVMVGSMGSLNETIRIGDVVLPNPSRCAYYGYQEHELVQNPGLLSALQAELTEDGIAATTYKHGSSFAVFDPHTDHASYTSSLYDELVKGVDCGEVFVGLEFACRSNLRVGAVLYCSDGADRHISAIDTKEFDRRAAEFDHRLNRVAVRAIRRSRHP